MRPAKNALFKRILPLVLAILLVAGCAPTPTEQPQDLQTLYAEGIVRENELVATLDDPSSRFPFDYLERFRKLYDINENIVGWLSVHGTAIATPVVRGNAQQVTRDFYGNEGEGVPYITVDTPLEHAEDSTNMVVHLDGVPQLRNTLVQYTDAAFYRAHPRITLDTVSRVGDWKIIAVLVADTPFYDNTARFENEESLVAYLDYIRARSFIDTPVNVMYGDELLTLTVPSIEFENARLVIVARLVRNTEEALDDYALATKNGHILQADAWYQAYGGQAPAAENLLSADAIVVEPEPVETEPPADSAETSSEETSSEETSSDAVSSEEVSSEESSSEDTSSEQASSEESSSEESSSEEPSSEDSSEESSEAPSSEDPSSEEESSEETSSEQEEPATPGLGDEMLTVRVDGRTVTDTAYNIVCQIVGNELNSSCPDEAIKAQAVAAHTYIRFHNNRGDAPSVGFRSPGSRIKKLVAEVIDELIYYKNKPIFASYFSISAGKTVTASEAWGGADYPYIQSVESKYDHLVKGYSKVRTIYQHDMQITLQQELGVTPMGDPVMWFDTLVTTESGYVKSMEINGVTVTGAKLRSMFGLRSTCFTIDYDYNDRAFLITSYGYGHGVGLSQHGAIEYANREGWDYKQILTHYYTGVEVR